MQYILKVHLFKTLEEANAAIEIINQGEGIPINETATTRTYTQSQENNGNIYILADSITQKYLGEPIDLELIYDEEI
jgi:archaellum component FlaG (FlaF/FlaG flagellin family)